MRPFRDLPINRKLTLTTMVTCACALAVVCGSILAYEVVHLRRAATAEASALAEVMAENATGVVLFQNDAEAARLLGTLAANPNVLEAALFTAGGEVLAVYPPGAAAPAVPGPAGTELSGGDLVVYQPMQQVGTPAGTFYLRAQYRARLLQRLRHYALTVGGAIVLAAALAFVLSRALGRVVADPVLELAAAARAVSNLKDYSLRVPRHAGDEVGSLAEAFNQMLAQIQQQHGSLQREIAERERAEAEIIRWSTELERSNQELDQFAYVASHDLKAPLRGIDNLANWIAEDAANILPAPSVEHLEKLRQRVTRMEGLLDDLLHYSRAGRVNRSPERVEPRALVAEVFDLLSPPPGIRLRNEVFLPPVMTSRTPFHQVLLNLVANAVKHHDRDQGEIAVRVRPAGEGRLEFEVEDDGPGIPPEFHERIFQMFQTLRPRDDLEGSGVGLAVVRKILDSHGESISVHPGPGGRGTAFRFTWAYQPVGDGAPAGRPESGATPTSASQSPDPLTPTPEHTPTHVD